MVMVLGPLRNKAESRAQARREQKNQQGGGRKSRERVDTKTAEPVTNSMADAMPSELKEQAKGQENGTSAEPKTDSSNE